MSPAEVGALWGITNGVPTLKMALAVWKMLIKFGGMLPDDDRPGTPFGPWQLDGLKWMIDHLFPVVEGCRQGFGKSFLAAILLCCYILLGAKCGIALTSLKQGSRVLMRRTSHYMKVLEPLFGLKRVTKNVNEVIWSNGAVLVALSHSEAGLLGTEGYTFRIMVLDEGHRLAFSNIGYFLPLVSVAMKRRVGKLLTIGVAGNKRSVIEVAKTKPEYQVLFVNDEEIIRQDDLNRGSLPPGHPRLAERSWREQFAEAERTMSRREYDKFYRLIPDEEGEGMPIFPSLASEGQPRFKGGEVRRRIGVDIGRVNDQTVAVLTEKAQGLITIKDVLFIPAMALSFQAQRIKEFAVKHKVPARDIGIEVNGLGVGIHDIMQHGLPPKLPALYPGVRAVSMSYDLKLETILRIQDDAETGTLIVPEGVIGNVDMREALEPLTYTVEYGKREQTFYAWEHSDELSALVIAYCADVRVGAF